MPILYGISREHYAMHAVKLLIDLSGQCSGVTKGGKGRHLPPGAALWGHQIEVGMLRTNYEMTNVSGC